MQMIHVTWKRIERLVENLARAVRASGFKPQCIVGITVGGVFPMALIAKEFNTKEVAVISARSYSRKRQGKLRVTALPNIDLRGKRVLLIDEMADRGTTLQYISKILVRQYKVKELKTATLVVNKKNCKYWPDFYVMEVDTWVVFPWDK